jgi:hypothetical protein
MAYDAGMSLLRRNKSRRSQAADLLGTYLKLKAVKGAAKGGKKAAKGTAVYKVGKTAAKRTPLRRLPLVAGVGVLGAVAVKKARRRPEAAQPA